MKNKLIIVFAALGIFLGGLKAQQTLSILHADQLIRIGEKEWLDASRVSYFRKSYTVDLSQYGGDSKYPIGNRLIVDGGVVELTDEGEKALLQVLK